MAFGAAGADLFKPRGPGDDLKGLALGVGVEPGENFQVGFAALDLREHGFRTYAGEGKEQFVDRAIVVVAGVLAVDLGAGLVEEAGEVGVAADANANAARRVDGEVGNTVVDHERGVIVRICFRASGRLMK